MKDYVQIRPDQIRSDKIRWGFNFEIESNRNPKLND